MSRHLSGVTLGVSSLLTTRPHCPSQTTTAAPPSWHGGHHTGLNPGDHHRHPAGRTDLSFYHRDFNPAETDLSCYDSDIIPEEPDSISYIKDPNFDHKRSDKASPKGPPFSKLVGSPTLLRVKRTSTRRPNKSNPSSEVNKILLNSNVSSSHSADPSSNCSPNRSSQSPCGPEGPASPPDSASLPVLVRARPCPPRHSPAMVLGGSTAPGHVDLEVKVILLGDYSVGKSSLLRVLARHSDQLLERHDNNGNGLLNSSSPSVRSDNRFSPSTRTDNRFSPALRNENRFSPSLRSENRFSPSLRSENRSSVSPRSEASRQSPPERAGGDGGRGPLIRSSLQPGGFVEVEFTHQDRTVLARIADTGGQERYRSMTTSYYRGAHGCLLMFDVTKEESFANLDSWIENIDCYKTNDQFSCILVGTRCNSPARRILYERAAEFADSRELPYMELDMDHMTDVRRVFGALLDSVTVNMNKRAPIAISIRPEISNKDMYLRKNVVCSC